MSSKDYFSQLAPGYSRYRPHYPKELFKYLSSLAVGHDRAWDCATGNGQAAFGLATHFKQIIATDLSEKQIANAIKHEKIIYAIAPAEKVDIESGSIDLITVAQALHWFDFDAFYKEAKRVLNPDGVIAAWAYKFINVSPSIDSLLEDFHENTIKPYWRPENNLVDNEFFSLPFPFEELEPPRFDMEALWDFDHLIGFLGTWSAVQRYKEENDSDPIESITEDLKRAWDNPETKKRISWPLLVRIGRSS